MRNALYQMALVSMTLGDHKDPKSPQFSTFCVTGEVRHFKFGGLAYHSMSQPVGDKPSRKGAWSGSRDQHTP